MRSRLLWKLLGVNLLVLALVVGALWVSLDYLAAGYFSELMHRYGIEPTMSHRMFVHAVHRYLVGASLAAVALAIVLSLLLTRRVLGPLSEMAKAAGGLAAGDFRYRVSATSRDEVGQLGAVFNRMAENLEHLEALRKSMVADVAHELRTPLTNVRGYLEALSDGVFPPSGDTFDLLLGEVRRLEALVERLLELARADAAKASLEKRPFSLHDLIRRTVEVSGPRYRARGLTLRAVLAPEADDAFGDPDRISQALENLVENARRYARPGTETEVRAERLDAELRVAVTNAGEEIPRSDLPLIFERFFVVDRSRSREGGGAGLGLAIVKELVAAHGGTVGASSGGGLTTVWFTFPA